jgi:PAS domain S-box-containing protein
LFQSDKLRKAVTWQRPGSWGGYLATIALVAAATLLRMMLTPLIPTMPFVTFYPAVILATLLGGMANGILAMALAISSAWLFFVSPGLVSGIEGLGLPNPLILFALISTINIPFIAALRGVMVRMQDVSTADRARDARELRQLADGLHNAAFALAIVDARTNAIQFANPAYAALRGMTVEQVRNIPILESYAPAERPRIRALIDVADRVGHVTYEGEYIRPDGSVLPVQIDVTSVRGPSGEVLYRIGTTRDITERKRAEAMTVAFDALDARLRQILDETPLAMGLFNPDNDQHVWVNATTYRMLGYTADEMIGRTRRDFVHPDDNLAPIAEPSSMLPEWDPTDRRLIAKSGRVVHVRTRVARLGPDSTGQDLMLGLAEDITRQRQVEAALRQAQKMEAIGNLAGGMAHDFNNLLAIIIGNLDLIETLPTDNPDIAELVTDATNAALRGADLTRNLLAFARRQPLQPIELPVNVVIEDITRLLARILHEDVAITLDLSPELWPVIADRAQLESCIVNLASNARDAMPRGGSLRIATANRQIDADYAAMQQDVCPGDYVMIEVADSGVGMSTDMLHRIFEPFFTTKANDKSSGLGLSMVFGFISQSGGHISVDSEPGSGTTFRLFLPRASAASEATTQASVSTRPLNGCGETVLLVEDNAALRRVSARHLTRLGYAVIEADNAESALGQLGCTPVHVLFTDVVMPGGMNGFELAECACKLQPDIKVLLTSGFPEEAHGQAGDGSGSGARLLHKPYRAEDLARELFAALHG